MQPNFFIQTDTGAAEDLSSCRLVMEVNANTFNYVLVNTRTSLPVVLKYFQLHPSTERPLAEWVREILYSDPLLNDLEYETIIIYNFPESNLVPEKYFKSEANRPLTELIYGTLNRGPILTEKIPWWELYNVYRLPSDIHNLFQQKFAEAKFWHYYSMQLKSYKMFNSKEEGEYIKIVFYSGCMIVLAFRDSRILLTQTVPYADRHDISYYLLSCCRQLEFNMETMGLTVGGMIEKKSALYDELKSYFLNIGFDGIEDKLRITESLQEYPLHYFSPMLKTALCV